MKLRGRFTLALALAALVPIAVAAVVTRQVIAASARADYRERRRTAEITLAVEVKRLREQVEAVARTLASHTHPFVGNLLLDLAKQTTGRLDYASEQWLREQSEPVMHGLSLDVLTITDKADRVLCSPHAPGKIGESNHPEVRERAARSQTRDAAHVYFVLEDITKGLASEPVLVAEASRIAQDGPYAVAVAVGRRVQDDLLLAVRSDRRIDARIVASTGKVLFPPTNRDWGVLAGRADHGLAARAR